MRHADSQKLRATDISDEYYAYGGAAFETKLCGSVHRFEHIADPVLANSNHLPAPPEL